MGTVETQSPLRVPFDAAKEIFIPAQTSQLSGNSELIFTPLEEPTLPATYQTLDRTTHKTQSNIQAFLQNDLLVPRLNKMHSYLIVAGWYNTTNPLHRQLLMNRTIVITEQIDLHLLWSSPGKVRILLKPLPNYLFSHSFWIKHICPFPEIHSCALGFLLSYSWLVCYPSDFRIALEEGLISPDVKYKDWATFMDSVTSMIDMYTLEGVNKRYRYGELRLSRINHIYRFAPKFRGKYLFRGFYYDHYRYSSFFGRNFGWLFAVFAVVTVLLAALQVGLATPRLSGILEFQRVAVGFTVFSLLLPLVGAGVIVFLFMSFVVNNTLVSALRYFKLSYTERRALRDRKAVAEG
jgi:hypothetical protein